ncbi:SRPBCC family protein [Nonomuraea sp. NN258]|uniref:SRPBCC family protein n=1 Tax=Nonomuraea antri TaxID=2730852 RepID=UPI00156A2345|nr:SRPBCC family protein [Nonomuraea antri]NRQ34917.1 SRPBCC family protein [Nonomuraea antri]
MAMRFEHEFTVPVPIEQAWAVLLDVERVAPCLPGATLDIFEGDEFTGRMKVKVGPITVTYRGSARFEDVDKDQHTLTIQASGKEARGSGTAAATVKARLTGGDGSTGVSVETSFNVTGRPAQFGRGVMAEVGAKLIDRFAANLAELLSEPSPPEVTAPEPEVAESTAEPESTVEEAPDGEPVRERAVREEERHLSAVPEPVTRPGGTSRTSRTPDEEALDLLEIAGTPLLKRLVPIAGAAVALVFVVWLIRRLMR